MWVDTNCCLIIAYVVLYCCFWEHVEEHFKNPFESYKNIMGTF
jgi:hypothetical protein